MFERYTFWKLHPTRWCICNALRPSCALKHMATQTISARQNAESDLKIGDAIHSLILTNEIFMLHQQKGYTALSSETLLLYSYNPRTINQIHCPFWIVMKYNLLLTNYEVPESEGSSRGSQEPATGPYSDPTESTPYSQPVSLRFILIASSHQSLGLPSGLFPSL
jgi:hypothetical protein